jgi:hypothetical protein
MKTNSMRFNLYPIKHRSKNSYSKVKIILCYGLSSFVLFHQISYAQTSSYTTAGSGSWLAPAGVNVVTAECWGGGGAGGGATGNPASGGAGGGGSYVKTSAISIIGGQSYNYSVGAGATGTTSTVSSGGDSWFISSSTILAKGGSGGIYANANNMTAASASALTSGNIGTISYYGGGGGIGGALGASSAGGGGSAGTASNGNNGSGITGGAAVTGGGAGGNGTNLSANGGNATTVGGGGGGAHAGNATDRLGGRGGAGKILLTYSCPTYSINTTSVENVCSGNASVVTLTGTASSLPVGIYTVVYNLSTPNAVTGATSTMTVSNAGIGIFSTSSLASAGSTTLTITQLRSSGCSTNISANRTAVITVTASANPIIEFTQGALDTVANIAVCGNVGGGGQNDLDLASGNPNGLMVQWQISYDSGSTWISAPGPTSTVSQYVLNPIYTTFESVAGCYYFRVMIPTASCGVAYSNTIVLHVTGTSNLTPGTIESNQNFCMSGDPVTLTQLTAPTGASGTYTYQWLSSTDNINYSIISGATAVTYNPPVINQSTYYKRITVSKGCRAETNSVAALITTAPPISPGDISGYATVCSNATGINYAINAVAGADSYTWTVPSGWSLTSGAGTTSVMISTGSASQSGNLTVYASNICGAGLVSVLPITLTNGSSAAILSGDTSLCSGSSTYLRVYITGGASPYEILYSDGSSDFRVADYTSGSGILVSPSVTTNYNLVSVKNTGGCYGTGNQGSPIVTMLTPGTWIGRVSQEWDNADNWCGGIPDSITDATITAGNPYNPVITSGTAKVRNLNLGVGTQLLTNNSKLKLYGTIISSSGLNCENGSLELCGASSSQTIAGNMFYHKSVKNLRLSNNNGITFSGTNDTLKVLGVLDFGNSNVTLNTNGNLTLSSNATATASVADMTSNGLYFGNRIAGDVTVERYIANHPKSWRFLSVPTFGQTIKNTWMEGNQPLSNSNNPGYGTIITSNLTGATTTLGFDIYTPSGATMKTFNPNTANWESSPSAYSIIANNKGYMLFIRGDRSVTAFNQAPTATTLRTTGILYTPIDNPPTSVNVQADKFESVGNPYASAVDFSKIGKSGGIQDVFYTWDPDLTTSQYSAYGYGGYQTIVRDGGGYIIIPGGGSYSSGNVSIKSGQAFFVRSAGSAGQISFSETTKSEGNEQASRLSSEMPLIKLNFSVLNSNSPVLLDGVVSQFDSAYAAGVDVNDILKIGNSTSENIGIMRDTKRLTMERRPSIESSDTIFYNLGSIKRLSYQFEISAQNLGANQYNAFLYDKYTLASTAINLNGSTLISFVVNYDAGSYAPDRFYLVINKTSGRPLHHLFEIIARRRDGVAEISWSGMHLEDAHHFVLEKSKDGIHFSQSGKLSAIKSYKVDNYSITDITNKADDFYYRVIMRLEDGTAKLSNTVLLPADKSLIGNIEIAPNPVLNKEINLSFQNQPIGKYDVVILSNEGVIIKTTIFMVKNKNEAYKIKLPESITAGNYKMTINSHTGKIKVISFQLN